MLSHDTSIFAEVKQALLNIYGPPDLESPVWQWDHTTYYEKEMGAGLKKQFVFFEKLIHPGDIADIKVKTNQLEQQYLNDTGGRRINLDPGYLDSAKLVLVSTKDFSHRIYIEKGIYGEVTLMYSGKNYQILPYTFPDFRTETYHNIFSKARDMYRKQR
jgi:hypothetical protein